MKGGQQISQQAGAAHNALIALPGIPDVPVAQLHSRVASRAGERGRPAQLLRCAVLAAVLADSLHSARPPSRKCH